MLLQTTVNIPRPMFGIRPTDRLLFVGSCFANNIGQQFKENMFQTIVNPYGVMYNPASILHTVERSIKDAIIDDEGVEIAVFTLGTNHVYILNQTGEIVDNCQKRPQKLFTERELSVEECYRFIHDAMHKLWEIKHDTKFILTVSPIRYAKYGFHGSQLSKATLLLAADRLTGDTLDIQSEYFPAYEIMNDELRDYRFYQPDMLHPSQQAVDYIFEKFIETYFTKEALQFIEEWKPIKQALQHRPFNPESEEYKTFISGVKEKEKAFIDKWLCK